MSEQYPTGLRWRALQLAKRGNTADEIEDALHASATLGRFAVADGVTDSIFSSTWARLLVQKFVAEPPPESLPWNDWLQGPRADWQQEIRQQPLPWYAEHKLSTGAAATLIGLQIHSDGAWNAIAVGDACLFHFRNQELLTAFPIQQSTMFDNRPAVLRSNPQDEDMLVERRLGTWRAGDTFALATDALAQWILAEHERNAAVWNGIDQLISTADDLPRIEHEINLLRDSRRLRNDDVALLVVDLTDRCGSVPLESC